MAKQTLTGIVTDVTEKDWEDRDTGNAIVLYSFQIEGDKRFFRTGTYDPGIEIGDAIRFAYDSRGNRADIDTIEVIDASEVEAAPKPRRSAGRSGNSRPSGRRSGGSTPRSSGRSSGSTAAPKENWDARAQYWADKEKRDIEVVEPRITFSAAQRDAVTLVSAALAQGLISFGKAAASAKFDMLLDAVDTVAARFYEQRISGDFGAPAPSAAAEDDYDEEE